MRRALALGLAVTGLAVAAPAEADEVVALGAYPGPGLSDWPQLVGERVAWSQEECIRGCGAAATNHTSRFEIFRASDMDTPRRLFRARVISGGVGPDSFSESYSFRLSEQVLATLLERQQGAEANSDASGAAELRAGLLGGASELLLSCRSNSFAFSPPAAFALDGTRLGFDPDPCDTVARLVVRDVATGTTRTLPEPAGGPLLKLRGRFVAWVEGSGAAARLVVYDLDAGAPAYSAPAVDVRDMDLDSDGTVAAVTGDPLDPCGTGHLVRYSAASPAPADLGVQACATGVRIDAGRIVFLGWEGFTRSLRVMDPTGAVEDLVRFGRALPGGVGPRGFVFEPGGFDFRGGRIAWTARNCPGGQSIFVGTVDQAPEGAGSINCRARYRSVVVPVRRGVATVRLRCPRGCYGWLRLRHLAELRQFSLDPGESAVRLRLTRRARLRVERRGSLEALAKMVTRNRAYDRAARLREVTLVAR